MGWEWKRIARKFRDENMKVGIKWEWKCGLNSMLTSIPDTGNHASC